MPLPSLHGCEKDTMTAADSASPFEDAFMQYIHSLPEKTKKREFIASCLGTNNPNTPEALFECVKEIEAKHSQKTSVKLIRKILKPIVSELKSFYNIIDTLVQVDAMPAAVIWGGLGVVINGLWRCFDLFDKIKNELLTLGTQLKRMAWFEDLYNDSAEMRHYLCQAYINIFRFYCRVDKECAKSSFSKLTRSAFSFSTKKLQDIVLDIETDANHIEKLAPIVEARKSRGEREDAAKERLEAGIGREEAKIERLESAKWRQIQHNDRPRDLYQKISSWLGPMSSDEAGAREYNLKRHKDNIRERFEHTCEWLLDDPTFVQWLDGDLRNSVIWARGGPGAGKSMLCSHAIQHVERLEYFTTTAFHFFQASGQWTALQTIRNIASQLFEKFWRQKQVIPEHVYEATLKSSSVPQNIEEFIKALIKEFPSTHIFLDGLDEEDEKTRWPDAANIISILLGSMKDASNPVKIWFSSQNKHRIRGKLQQFPTITIQDQTERDVHAYLSHEISSIHQSEVDEETRKWILIEVQHRANGNFLFARLMVKAIQEEVGNVDDMREFIENGLPMDLDAYYERAFLRYEIRQRAIVCKAFSILAFARRPLRLTELMDAIGIIDKFPFKAPLSRVLTPMIDVQEDPQDHNDEICHIFHSTLRTFLLNHPSVFRQTIASNLPFDLSVTRFAIANACLSYLAQPKFSRCLQMVEGRWLTISGEDIMKNHFLTYSAKYWDKHMQYGDDFPDMSSQVANFLTSTNFVTTLQVQSLCIAMAFGSFSPRIREALRDLWTFTQNSKVGVHSSGSFWNRYGGPYRNDYVDFQFEWKYFLHKPTCYDERCRKEKFQGEIDRVLWAALGSKNFLSKNVSRYNNFVLDAPLDTAGKSSAKTGGRYWEAFSIDGSEAHVLQVLPPNHHDIYSIRFSCQNWDLTAPIPNCTAINIIEAQKNEIAHEKYWPIGIQYPVDDEITNAVSFSIDLKVLRIGSQIFIKNTSCQFIPSFSFGLYQTGVEKSLEEFAASKSYVAFATRQKRQPNKENQITKRIEEVPSSPIALPKLVEDSANGGDNDDDLGSSDEGSGSSSDDDLLQFDSASESWSEGSTNVDEESESEEDSSQSSTKSSRSSSVSSSASENVVTTREALLTDSDDESEVDLLNVRITDDESDIQLSDDSGDEEASDYRLSNRPVGMKAPNNILEKNGLLLVYDISSLTSPKLLFRYRRPLPVSLSDSPPVFHPTKSLLVWPLFGGEILFADFQLKTFFTRKAGVSARNTRLVSTHCHFSPDKETLHTMSLEAKDKNSRKPIKKGDSDATEAPKILSLYIIVATYQLSSRKTSRSPPTIIYHKKLFLGDCTSDSLSRSPVTLTWTPEFLYVTSSSNQLYVYRISLFKDETDRAHEVLAPSLPIYLPDSARIRDVRYFPPNSPRYPNRGTITISSRSPAQEVAMEWVVAGAEEVCENQGGRALTSICPPIGLFIDEDKDLGGWQKREDVVEVAEEGFGDGNLNRRLEFQAADDCIFESFLF